MTDLFGLLAQYSWHLALVGLIGTILIGLLKKPLNIVIAKKFPPETNPIKDSSFDTIAFILGFFVAIILSVIYSLLASKLCWVSQSFGWIAYITNIFAVWTFQIVYYNIWKKLGLKRLLLLLWSGIKKGVTPLLDKNKDGKVDFSEAARTIQGLLKGGKLDIDEVLKAAETIVPGIAQEVISSITKEAGDAAMTDVAENINNLDITVKQLTTKLVEKIPNDQVASVTTAIVNASTSKIKELLDIPKPTIKF